MLMEATKEQLFKYFDGDNESGKDKCSSTLMEAVKGKNN